MALEITTTARWHEQFPGGYVGVLEISDVDNAKRESPLEPMKREIEARLRTRYAGYVRLFAPSANVNRLEVFASTR